jgi:hypothetical protein
VKFTRLGFPNLAQMGWLARSRSLGPRGPLASPRSLSPPPRRLKSHCVEMRCRAKRAECDFRQGGAKIYESYDNSTKLHFQIRIRLRRTSARQGMLHNRSTYSTGTDRYEAPRVQAPSVQRRSKNQVPSSKVGLEKYLQDGPFRPKFCGLLPKPD